MATDPQYAEHVQRIAVLRQGANDVAADLFGPFEIALAEKVDGEGEFRDAWSVCTHAIDLVDGSSISAAAACASMLPHCHAPAMFLCCHPASVCEGETMRRWCRIVGLIVLLLVPCAYAQAGAAAPDPSVARIETIRKLLLQRFPDSMVLKVQPAAWPGIFEVITHEEIVYTNATVDWLMMGELLDAHTRDNLTTRSWNDYWRIDYGSLPFDRAIKLVRGSGKRQMAIFEDPLCPYCRELEETVSGIDDVTVFVFLYPLEELHAGATEMAQKIWCTDDRATAWSAWMHDHVEPVAVACEQTPVEVLQRLGNELKIHSTPTLFMPDGLRISGALKKGPLEELLARQAPAAPAATARTAADRSSQRLTSCRPAGDRRC
jgi:thiol:disulfide interchange protein DsbC